MKLIKCPLKEVEIEEYDCFELSMAAEGLAPKSYLSDNNNEIERLRKICLQCSNHRND